MTLLMLAVAHPAPVPGSIPSSHHPVGRRHPGRRAVLGTHHGHPANNRRARRRDGPWKLGDGHRRHPEAVVVLVVTVAPGADDHAARRRDRAVDVHLGRAEVGREVDRRGHG